MRNLIKKQKANGSFPFDALKVVLHSISMDSIRSAFKDVPHSPEVEELMITIIACVYLELTYAQVEGNWKLVVKKARQYVQKNSKNLNLSVDWDASARNFLSGKI